MKKSPVETGHWNGGKGGRRERQHEASAEGVEEMPQHEREVPTLACGRMCERSAPLSRSTMERS